MAEDTEHRDAKTSAIALAVVWTIAGLMAYALIALLVLFAGERDVDAMDETFRIASSLALCGSPWLLVFGWVPAVLRILRGRDGALRSGIAMAVSGLLLAVISLAILLSR